MPESVVAATTAALTLGVGMATPDPALQPLVPIGGGKLAIPGSVVLSSNWSRNMLSLHARVSERSFDTSSAAFEHIMIAAIKTELPNRFDCHTSIKVPAGSGFEEVDLVLIDHRVRSMLFGELRWMLQPGDVREVLNRKKVIKEKVRQVNRKVAGARASLPDVGKRFGVSGDWTINGAVIIEGFGGAPSDDPNVVPVVPRDVFVRAIVACPNLEHAHAALCSPLWLPREGSDYIRRWEKGTICGLLFNRPGFDIGARSYMGNSLDTYLAEAFSRIIDDLRRMPW